MEFMDLATNRYSERYFDTDRPVEQEKIDKILEAGQTRQSQATGIS